MSRDEPAKEADREEQGDHRDLLSLAKDEAQRAEQRDTCAETQKTQARRTNHERFRHDLRTQRVAGRAAAAARVGARQDLVHR